jgi:hypothetical protein
MQTLATGLMMISVLTICIIVHILTNIQKKVAFHKIERSVSTHLDVNKENSKQVNFVKILYQSHSACAFMLSLSTMVSTLYYHAIGKAIIVHLPEGCCLCCTEGPQGGTPVTAKQ